MKTKQLFNPLLIYSLFLAGLTFTELFLTKNITKYIVNKSHCFAEYIGFSYLILNTKALLVLDAYYFSAFYIQKKISALMQVRIIKCISVMMWLIVSCRLYFGPKIIIYIVLQACSFLYLSLAANSLHNIIYQKYNKSISADANVLSTYIFSEVVDACRVAVTFSLFLVMITAVTNDIYNGYLVYSTIKCGVIFIDKVLQRNKQLKNLYYEIITLLYSSLGIFGIIYIIYLIKERIIHDNMVFLVNEILLFVLISMLYSYLFMKWSNKFC